MTLQVYNQLIDYNLLTWRADNQGMEKPVNCKSWKYAVNQCKILYLIQSNNTITNNIKEAYIYIYVCNISFLFFFFLFLPLLLNNLYGAFPARERSAVGSAAGDSGAGCGRGCSCARGVCRYSSGLHLNRFSPGSLRWIPGSTGLRCCWLSALFLCRVPGRKNSSFRDKSLQSSKSLKSLNGFLQNLCRCFTSFETIRREYSDTAVRQHMCLCLIYGRTNHRHTDAQGFNSESIRLDDTVSVGEWLTRDYKARLPNQEWHTYWICKCCAVFMLDLNSISASRERPPTPYTALIASHFRQWIECVSCFWCLWCVSCVSCLSIVPSWISIFPRR